MNCPFCNSKQYKKSFYPKLDFNVKLFEYICCKECSLTYINPMPNEEDYSKMYPTSYQNDEVDEEVQEDWYQKLPGLRFSYGYQFDLIRKYAGENATVLDYGCGNAHFIVNASKAGFICDGAEYNPKYVELLKQKLTNIDCFTINSVLTNQVSKKYDVIRLSNVLEHLTNPKEVLSQLSNFLNPEGIFLIEGPIEHNFSIAQLFRNTTYKLVSFFKPNRVISFPPYHIFLSNYSNQKELFQTMNLQNVLFVTDEDPWPFPENLNIASSVKEKLMAIIGSISRKVTKRLSNNWGNIFLYVGRKA